MNNNFLENIKNRKSPYVIAEIGINHNGSVSLAKEMISAAKTSGASCVKFQSFKADKYISDIANKANYQVANSSSNISQKEIIRKCELDANQLKELFLYAKKLEIDFLSTPFEIWSLEELISLGIPAIKISSCNLTNIQFLHKVVSKKLPVLLSTGMANLREVVEAVSILKNSNIPFMIFQCTSNYPSKHENANLNVLTTFKRIFNTEVGLSDHTSSNITSIAAIALGAIAIEKHFTISKKLPGIDQMASLEPHEFKSLVDDVKACKLALGSFLKFKTEEENDTSIALRRSLVAANNLNAGQKITKNCLSIMRPGSGLQPSYFSEILGKKLTKDIKKGTPIKLEHFLLT